MMHYARMIYYFVRKIRRLRALSSDSNGKINKIEDKYAKGHINNINNLQRKLINNFCSLKIISKENGINYDYIYLKLLLQRIDLT